jgi:hypothetical protein
MTPAFPEFSRGIAQCGAGLLSNGLRSMDITVAGGPGLRRSDPGPPDLDVEAERFAVNFLGCLLEAVIAIVTEVIEDMSD